MNTWNDTRRGAAAAVFAAPSWQRAYTANLWIVAITQTYFDRCPSHRPPLTQCLQGALGVYVCRGRDEKGNVYYIKQGTTPKIERRLYSDINTFNRRDTELEYVSGNN